MRGQPFHASAATGEQLAWAAGGPYASLCLHIVPVRAFYIQVATEGGYWLFPTGGLVNGRREVALEGGWLGVQLGLGIIL